MIDSWIVLLPPLLVLALAFTTHRVLLSIFCGIVTASLIFHRGALVASAKTIGLRLWQKSELHTFSSWESLTSGFALYMFLFLLAIGVLINLISHSGGAYAYGAAIRKKIKNARSAESASLVMSMMFFIDDFFSCITVGAVMQPILDKFNIPRAKTAFLVDSLAAPLCMIAPISSWVAVVVMYLQNAGISSTKSSSTLVLADPYYMFLKIIPFIFYSSIIFVSVWFIVRKRISFGLMYKHERIAKEKGNLFGGKEAPKKTVGGVHESNKKDESIIDFIFPFSLLLVSSVVSILYFGGYKLFGGAHKFLESFRHSNITLALFIAVMITTIASIILLFIRKKLCIKTFPRVFYDGVKLMLPSVAILLLAWTFSSLLQQELGTGTYLAKHLIGNVPIVFIPVLFLIVSSISSSAMGSAWGAMAVMIPIAVPMIVTLHHAATPANWFDLPLLLPTMGAIFSGAVSGNHLSPISDTTIMSARGVGCHQIDHVKTQLWFSVPTIIATCVAFIVSGFMMLHKPFVNIAVSMTAGLATNFIILGILNKARVMKNDYKYRGIK